MAVQRRPAERERGATMILVAFAMITLLMFTALAVDIGAGAARTRDLQQVADLVSLDVARLFDGRSEAAVIADPLLDQTVIRTAAANDFPVSGHFPTYTSGTRRITLDLGCWHISLHTFSTTCANLVSTTGTPPPNAVEVRAFDTVDYQFADVVGIKTEDVSRDAIGARIPKAAVSVGSVAIGYQQALGPANAGVGGTASAYVQALNARLRAAFGVSGGIGVNPPPNGVGLDLVSYRGLAASDVTLGDLATAAGFATPNEMADATITNGQLLEAAAVALESQGNTQGAASLRSFAGQSDFNSAGTLRLGDGPFTFEQGTGTADDPGAARATVNVLELLTGAATIANGRNFVGYQFNPGIPGVARVDVQSSVIEGVRTDYGWAGQAHASTAEVRHQITIVTSSGALGLPAIPGLPGLPSGPASPVDIPITIPIVLEGATADAYLTRTDCFEDPAAVPPTHPFHLSETAVHVDTSLLRASIGVAQNLQTPDALVIGAGTIIDSPFLSLGAIATFGLSGLVTLGSDLVGLTTLTFGGGSTGPDLVFHPYDVNPPQRAPGGLSGGVNIGTSLKGSLNLGTILGTNTVLNGIFTNLGAAVLDPILAASGITVGGADVLSHSLDCQSPELVG